MIKIVGLVLPWETYALPKVISSFISCKTYLSEDQCKDIKFSLTYSNVPEQINWDESLAPPLYTETIFNQCCDLLSKYYNVSYEVNNDIKGCVGHRRIEFNKNDYDYCVTFDFDMNFPSSLLKAYSIATKKLNKDDLLVITPQIPLMWDDSWDDVSLFDADFRHEYYKKTERFNINLIQPRKAMEIKELQTWKWFGGMFPCYSKAYLKEYPLHKDLGDGYGPDDYYLMLKGSEYKKVKQYLIENLVVENSKHYWGHFTNKKNYKFNYYAKKISDEQLFKLI